MNIFALFVHKKKSDGLFDKVRIYHIHDCCDHPFGKIPNQNRFLHIKIT